MTEKQKRFAQEYVIDCNATRAYKVAYPKVKSDEVARKLGSRMMTNDDVKAYIDELLAKIRSEKVAAAQEVMEYLTSVMRGQSKSEIVVVELTGEGCSSAKHIEKTPDEKERLKAAELIGKRYGLYTDKIETDVESVIIVNDLKE